MIRNRIAEEVEPGDLIYTPDGTPRRVTSRRRLANDDLVITYSIGALRYDMNPVHPHQTVEVDV